MGKYRNVHTPEQKKQYWWGRIIEKLNRPSTMFHGVEEIISWAWHADLNREERENLALAIHQNYSRIMAVLVPEQAEEQKASNGAGDQSTESQEND